MRPLILILKTLRLSTLVSSVVFAPLALAEPHAARCDSTYQLSDGDHAIEPGRLVAATQTLPAHCRVRGTVADTIRFEVNLPVDGWNGRLMFHAPGGLAGVIGDATSLLADGFAMATTDSGHEGPNDPSFYRDDTAKNNFGFRSNHLSTVAAKRIIQHYYDREVAYSYL